MVIPEQLHILGSVRHDMEYGAPSLPPAGAARGGCAQAGTTSYARDAATPGPTEIGVQDTCRLSTSSELTGPLFLRGECDLNKLFK